MTFKNRNRGYQKLRVWQDAVEYYAQTCKVFRSFPYEWIDGLMVKETNAVYLAASSGTPALQCSSIPGAEAPSP